VPGLALSSLLRERLKERKTKADPPGVGGRCARRRPPALVRADSSLHGVTECLGIRAPAPGIVPGEISFEIGQVPEKPEAIDDTLNHLVEVRPLVPAKKSGEIGNIVIAGAGDPLAEPAIEGKSYVEYDEHEVFIAKGEVYTAYRTISNIMSQAQKEILVIDPYVDEDLLDMFAGLDPSVKIRVLTEHLKGNFKLALRKLQQQRVGIEVRCSAQFHDRFIVVDGKACYQLGGSINHAGAKATVIGTKSDAIRDRVIAEAEKAWSAASPVS